MLSVHSSDRASPIRGGEGREGLDRYGDTGTSSRIQTAAAAPDTTRTRFVCTYLVPVQQRRITMICIIRLVCVLYEATASTAENFGGCSCQTHLEGYCFPGVVPTEKDRDLDDELLLGVLLDPSSSDTQQLSPSRVAM